MYFTRILATNVGNVDLNTSIVGFPGSSLLTSRSFLGHCGALIELLESATGLLIPDFTAN